MKIYYSVTPAGRTLLFNNKSYLFFGGTAYLGLQTDPGYQNTLAENILRHGTSHGASRLSNIRMKIFEQGEEKLASWCGSEAALTLSSGYLAGQLLAQYFSRGPYKLFYGPNVHAALLATAQSPFQDYESLSEAIAEHLRANKEETPVLFIDSIDLTGNTYPDYKALLGLPLDRLILVADDSHGLGLVGQGGGGNFRKLASLQARELVVCGSMAKALGLQGGVILGTKARCAQLWETPFFAGASPPPPAHIATFLSSQKLYDSKRQRLSKLLAQFETLWQQRQGFTHLANYPVTGFSNAAITTQLAESGILVTDFPYPSARESSPSGRIVICAQHREEDIKSLAAHLNTISLQGSVDKH